jgi:hypothetical protein
MRFEFLLTHGTNKKFLPVVHALVAGAAACGDKLVTMNQASFNNPIFMYGPGGDDRYPSLKKAVKLGVPVITFDAGYWHRAGSLLSRKYRISFNTFHNPERIFDGPRPPAARLQAAGLLWLNEFSPDGPIILVGNSTKIHKIRDHNWAKEKLRELRARFPDKQIWYRPKPRSPLEVTSADKIVATQAIQDVLRGASLVVCLHSNVAIDACLQGIPVVCEDGAAASIYPSKLVDYKRQPDQDRRQEFMERLAYWQWSGDDCRAGTAWPWIISQLNAHHENG